MKSAENYEDKGEECAKGLRKNKLVNFFRKGQDCVIPVAVKFRRL
jgi:hypothetical protein